MVVFVLDHIGVEPGDLALRHHPVAVHAAVADARGARHRGAQAGDRQAALPVQHALVGQQLDHRIDQHRVADRHVERILAAPPGRDAEHEQPQRDVDLRRRQADAGCVHHRLDHVGDQAADLRRARVVDRGAALQQNGVAHAGDLQKGHAGWVRLGFRVGGPKWSRSVSWRRLPG